jgi:uncharacterized membrane protein YphA (DoxX/SURF4 family)
MYYATPYFITLGRVLLSIMFIQAGISKIFGYAGTQAMMESPMASWECCCPSSS